jgi:hypothetical protein
MVKKKSQLELMLQAVAETPRRTYNQNNFKFLRSLLLTNLALLAVALFERGSLAVDIVWLYCPAVNLIYLAVGFFRGTGLRKRSTDYKQSRHIAFSLLPLGCLLIVELTISQIPGHASAVDAPEKTAPAAAPARRR